MAGGVDQAIARAAEFLRTEAARGFPEARHHMRFPRWAGFGGPSDQHTAEAFGRAVIGDLLIDIAEARGTADGAIWRDIARAQADAVAAARLTDRFGGWSYFPDLPELPPDLDSLAAATRLFARAARHHLPLVDAPIACALAGAQPDGGIRTWILAPENDARSLKKMRRGVKRHWGDTVDLEVCARFYLALASADPTRFATDVRRGAELVAAAQANTGGWPATWYAGDVYGTALCAQLMAATGQDAAVDRARAALRAAAHPGGGWGTWEPVPLDTAIALSALGPEVPPQQLDGAVAMLLRYQNPDGSWPGTPWIKMEVGRAIGRVIRTITWQSDTITTAFVLRALTEARPRPAAPSPGDGRPQPQPADCQCEIIQGRLVGKDLDPLG